MSNISLLSSPPLSNSNPPINYTNSTVNLVNLLAASAADPTLFAQGDYDDGEGEEESDHFDNDDEVIDESPNTTTTTTTSTSSDDDDGGESPSTPTTFSSLSSSLYPPTTTATSTSTTSQEGTKNNDFSTASNISSLPELSQANLLAQLAIDQEDAIDDAVYRAQRKASISSIYSTKRVKDNLKEGGILVGEEIFAEPSEIDEEHTKGERLAKLVEEFGVWSDNSEKFVQSIPGALYRGVLVKGVLALTNRRLFFFAYVPPIEHAKSIRSGPVTIHFPGLFKKSSRVWSDLTDDSVTWYKSSSTLYRPIGACRLSQVKTIQEYNENEPYIVRIDLIDGRKRILELDTAESALAWRADIEAAVFTFRSTADRLRFSLPLQRVKRVLVEPYMTLAEKVELTFDAGVCDEDAIASCQIDSGKVPIPEEDILPSSNLTTIEFGYIKSHHEFSVELSNQVDLSTTATSFCGGTQPILEIDSEVRKEDQVLLQNQLTSEISTPSSESILRTKFMETFALEDEAKDFFLVPRVELVRTLPTWGSLVISKTYLCFWRRRPIGTDTKLRIPIADLDAVGNCKAFGFRIFGLSIQVRGSPDVRFDFHSRKLRDETVSTLQTAILTKQLELNHLHSGPQSQSSISSSYQSEMSGRSSEESNRFSSGLLRNINTSTSIGGSSTTRDSNPSSATTTPSSSSPSSASPYSFTHPHPHPLTSSSTSASPYTLSPIRSPFEASVHQQTLFGQDLEETVLIPAGMKKIAMPALLGAVGRRKLTGLHFVCLTIGSRGDVQPYIALGVQLIQDGNRVTIASHPEYRQWVESFGIGFREVGGDPAALMKLSIEHTLFSPAWFKESLGHFRGWLDNLFIESWEACQGADILIESPSTMAGIHVAEALNIPYFRAFTMPWSSTSAYPHAFGSSVDLGPTYNSLSYSIFDNVIWKATAGQVNRFRKQTLKLPPTSMHKMSSAKTPFIYNFSTAVVPKPNDWRDFICVSGYWFLDDEKLWTPPTGLLEFIQKARDDNKAIIYVGFGSIIVPDANAMTRSIINATKNADVRVVLSKGWSDRGGSSKLIGEEPIIPEEIFTVVSIAHDRLFPLIDAAVIHGGAGTTGASLRAGLPTLIHPFFGDQFFWSSRVQKLGTGLKIDTLSEKDLTVAFKQGTTDRIMKEKARLIGEKIRSENGVRTAINFITDHIHLAQERGDLRAARARKEKNKSIVHTRTFSSGGGGGTNSSPFKCSPRASSPSTTPSGRPSTPNRSSTGNLSSSSTPIGTSSFSNAPLVSTPLSLDDSSTEGDKAGFKWCPIKNAISKRSSSLRVKRGKGEKEEEVLVSSVDDLKL